MMLCNFYWIYKRKTVHFPAIYICCLFTFIFLLNVLDMTETELMGHGFSLMLDGTMTSGTSLAFVLYELARHSDCQQKTYEEIKEVLERHDNKLTWEALLEMKYLKMVISGIYSFF